MTYSRKAPPAEPNDAEISPVNSTAELEGVSRRKRRRRRSGILRRVRRAVRRVRWGKILLVAVAIAAVAVVTTVAIIADSANRVQASITSFQRVVSSFSTRESTELTMMDFDRLNSSVGEVVNSLENIRSRLRITQPFTPLNANLRTTMTSVDAGYNLALAARDILNGLQPTLFFLVSGNDSQTVVTQISSAERVVELLRIGRGQFITAGERLASAQNALNSLNLEGAGSSSVLEIQQLISYHDQLVQINNVLLDAPNFLASALGISAQRSYLVLSQNNDELRPSGGYISTYGWLTLRSGRVTDYNYSPTTTTSPNPPPADFASQIAIPDWWLRYREPIYAAWDGSWYADFPSTAIMAMAYYNAGDNPQSPVDGAIAIDITGFEYLLEVIGQVSVAGYDEPVTAANFRNAVYDIRSIGANEGEHKAFVAALYQQIFADWQSISLDPAKNNQLLTALLKAIREKHIMLYFSDESLNNALNLLGWSGAQAPATDHDYLMVVDANLGNKSNHSIIRSLTYDVDIQDSGTVQGRMTVSYDYSARTAASDPAVNPPTNGPADYNNLLQIFVPQGTTFNAANNLPAEPVVSTNGFNTAFISRLFIPFDSTERYQFSYTTPPIVEQLGSYQRYRLLVQKQPGTPANAVNVQVMLPANATFVSSTPQAAASYNLERPILEYRTDLSVDRWIEIIYQQ